MAGINAVHGKGRSLYFNKKYAWFTVSVYCWCIDEEYKKVLYEVPSVSAQNGVSEDR